MKATLLVVCLFQSLTNAQDASKMLKIEFLGTYLTGRAPCEWLPDGSRRWAKTAGFKIDTIIKGDLKKGYIEITQERYENNDPQLQKGEVYTVCIALSAERFAKLELGNEDTIMTYEDPILSKEIMSIKKEKE